MNSLEKPIASWFKKHQRDLPWRNTTPWGVLVSEFMLQQTPVNRVLPKWNEWMQRWPTPAELAKATPAEVITAWGRLGYPRRALRLHATAQIISTWLHPLERSGASSNHEIDDDEGNWNHGICGGDGWIEIDIGGDDAADHLGGAAGKASGEVIAQT